MENKLLTVTVIALVAVLLLTVGMCFYIMRPVEVYGLELKANANQIDLSDADIASVDELIENLKPFAFLKKLDLGDFAVPIDEEERLLENFKDVDMSYKRSVLIYGNYVNADETSLDLSDKGITDFTELEDALNNLSYITSVDLRGNKMTFEQQTALAKEFPAVHFIWEVDLLGKTYVSDIDDLDLSGNKKVTPDIARQYVPLFKNLKRLDMSDCGATNEEMAALRADLPGIKVVWRVHMGQWSLKTDAVAFSVLIYNYNHKRLTSKDIEVLKYCTDLQALDIGHQAVTDISVLGDYLPQLRILILADNQVSDLTPVAKMKHLHYIELFVNSHKLTDISPLASCRELVDVNISYLHNVRDISPLYELPLLERVWVEHMPAPAEQIQTLREKHPNANIVNVGEGSVDKGWRTHERYFAMIGMFHDKNCKVLSESFSKYDQ